MEVDIILDACRVLIKHQQENDLTFLINYSSKDIHSNIKLEELYEHTQIDPKSAMLK